MDLLEEISVGIENVHILVVFVEVAGDIVGGPEQPHLLEDHNEIGLMIGLDSDLG